jgi:uncharacterized membrane protein YgdD (TMEM256/DUF423 family)
LRGDDAGQRRSSVRRIDALTNDRPTAHHARLRQRTKVGGFFSGGTLLFCSSLYALCASENRASKMRKAGPVGACMLVAGWLALAVR